jgi:hypothetical protein
MERIVPQWLFEMNSCIVDWNLLPGDILRKILFEHLNPLYRVASCWRVCRRWNWELTRPLADIPYSALTKRTMDLTEIRECCREGSFFAIAGIAKRDDAMTTCVLYRDAPDYNPWCILMYRIYAFHMPHKLVDLLREPWEKQLRAQMEICEELHKQYKTKINLLQEDLQRAYTRERQRLRQMNTSYNEREEESHNPYETQRAQEALRSWRH